MNEYKYITKIRQTDQQTNTTCYTDAMTHLEIIGILVTRQFKPTQLSS